MTQARTAGGKTILLVEDDPAIALIVRETLAGECARAMRSR